MFYYTLINMSFGQAGLVWIPEETPFLCAVILPENHLSIRYVIRKYFPKIHEKENERINSICRRLQEYDEGKDVIFSPQEFELSRRGDFYSRVWTETAHIPRGNVRTYGQVARDISSPKAARAVGTALAGNPLPLIVPCHRVVRADGNLSGFGGGKEQAWIKKHLLEREGIFFDKRGRIMSAFS
jgi:methylated-DNA-[protein]-cysteine S-methyltransferase